MLLFACPHGMTEQEQTINAHGFDIHISPVGEAGEGLHIEASSSLAHIIFESSKDGLLARREKPLAPQPPSPPTQSTEQTSTPEGKVYQAKFNLGSDPFPITTTEGPMHLVLAYLREINNRPVSNEKPKTIKIAVLPTDTAFILDTTQATDRNPKGYLLRKGDFVKAQLTRRDFVHITGKPGSTREVPVQGFLFTEKPTLLNPRHKPQKIQP